MDTQKLAMWQEAHISKHPSFSELKERYEWDEQQQAFPATLKNGAPNPLYGVTGVIIGMQG